MLELFLSTLPGLRYDPAPFTLGHPDLDSQTVFFVDDETGEISALIGWDGVAVLPRQLGALGCPTRLTDDRDPMFYEKWKDNSATTMWVTYMSIGPPTSMATPSEQAWFSARSSHITAAIQCALTAPFTTNVIVFQLGKPLSGSAMLTLDFAEGIRDAGCRPPWSAAVTHKENYAVILPHKPALRFPYIVPFYAH